MATLVLISWQLMREPSDAGTVAVVCPWVQGPAVPTLWRCAFGHGKENATLPLGAVCAVDTARGTLELATPQECEAMWAAVRCRPD